MIFRFKSAATKGNRSAGFYISEHNPASENYLSASKKESAEGSFLEKLNHTVDHCLFRRKQQAA